MYIEKIQIYVPQSIEIVLRNDALLFEIFKKNTTEINMNAFLSRLVLGFTNRFEEKERSSRDLVAAVLADECGAKRAERLSQEVIEKLSVKGSKPEKGTKRARLSLKPTKGIQSTLTGIEDAIGEYDTLPRFLSRMLVDYCKLPIFQREKIIFSESYRELMEAIDRGEYVLFTTIWNKNRVHKVLPMSVSPGSEEMNNYLLCQEHSDRLQQPQAATFRLGRIDNLKRTSEKGSFDEDVKRRLELMKEKGPQFAINDEREVCVRLTEQGIASYNRIIRGRPVPDRIVKSGDNYLYYFNCSMNQLHLYFRRFEGGSAEVVYPDDVRQEMIRFHNEALEAYSVQSL